MRKEPDQKYVRDPLTKNKRISEAKLEMHRKRRAIILHAANLLEAAALPTCVHNDPLNDMIRTAKELRTIAGVSK